MPTTYSTELKVKTIRRYEKGESIKALSQELHISTAPYTNGAKNTVRLKLPTTPTPMLNSMPFPIGCKNWNITWRLSARPGIYPVYHCRKDSPHLRNSTIDPAIPTVSTSYVMLLMWQEGPSITILWVSDITYFKVKSYWVYLCIILDLYSRKIIGWRISRHMSTHLVPTTFKTTYQERRQPQNLTFHSDRGSQYVSKTLAGLFQQHGVNQSFSATARPLDNAVSETFFSSFKREEAYRKDYTSEQHFRRSVDEYIRFYNEVRPH